MVAYLWPLDSRTKAPPVITKIEIVPKKILLRERISSLGRVSYERSSNDYFARYDRD